MQQIFTTEEMQDFSHEQLSALRRYWLRNYTDNFQRMKSGFKSIASLPDLGFGKPAAVLGGAPTEPEIYEMLGKMKVTTVCCDKTLPKVLPYLRPNFVTALNTQKTELVELEEWFADSKDMGLIVPVTVHPKTVELWKGEVYWMNPTNIHEDLQMRIEQETGIQPSHRGLNVGEFSLLMAGFMRPAEVALFGMWYAWKTEDEVLSYPVTRIASNAPLPESYSLLKLVDKGDVWYTNLSWMSSRVGFMEFCKSLHTQGIEIFNCSMGGILYHPDYCKEMLPEEFMERWIDDESGPGWSARRTLDEGGDTDNEIRGLPMSTLRVPDAPDKQYDGD